MSIATPSENGKAAEAETPEGVRSFIAALGYQPGDRILIRPVESWTEDGKKRTRTDYKRTVHPEPAILVRPDYWARILQRSEAERTNVFFGVCPRLDGKERFDLAWQIRRVPVLWADLDNCSVEQARERCAAAGLPPPSMIVRSGHGVHLYWLLTEAFHIDDAGKPAAVFKDFIDQGDGKKKKPVRFLRRGDEQVYQFLPPQFRKPNPDWPTLSPKALHAQTVLAGIAGKIGGDHTQDLARLLRLPDTMNRKDQRNGREPVPCELEECEPERRYPFAEFERFAAAAPDPDEVAPVHLPPEAAAILLPVGSFTKLRAKGLRDLANVSAAAPVGKRSEADFSLCCYAVEQGLDKEKVWTEVEGVGKFAEKGREYFERTWGKAENKTRLKIYQQAREKTADPKPKEPPAEDALPIIVVLGDEPTDGLKKYTPLGLSALAKANQTPRLFTKGAALVRLHPRSEDASASLEPLSPDALCGELDRAASWGAEVFTKKGAIIRFGPPPKSVVRDILALPGWDAQTFPPVDLVAESPRFLPDGRLVTTPGYHREARLYYDPPAELLQLDLPAPIQDEHVEAAVALLLDHYLGDFPFANRASKAHALVCMLQPLVRLMIPGPVPLLMVGAPTEGTGKGLLVEACAFPVLGRELESTPQKEDNAEWRKALTSALMTGRSHIFIDNMFTPMDWKRENFLPVDSGALAAALTQAVWSDRILGGNREVQIPIRVNWVATGNNVEWSPELARRVVEIRLEPTTERPWERDDFKHPDLKAFARENRKALLQACLVLCQFWIDRGRVNGAQTLGSYEAWSRTMGGILEVAGVVGFLENKTAAAARAGDSQRWPILCQLWFDRFGRSPTTTADLWDVIRGSQTLSEEFADVLGEGSNDSQKKRLGKAILRQEGRVWCGRRVERSEVATRTGSVRWMLRPVEQEQPSQEQPSAEFE